MRTHSFRVLIKTNDPQTSRLLASMAYFRLILHSRAFFFFSSFFEFCLVGYPRFQKTKATPEARQFYNFMLSIASHLDHCRSALNDYECVKKKMRI